MIVIEPRKLSVCGRIGSWFGVPRLSRFTASLSSMPTLISCRCLVAGGGKRRRVAGGVRRCRSRVDCHCRAWPEHRGCTWRDGQLMVFARAINYLWDGHRGRDIGIDSFTTQLVVNRRLTHRENTVEVALPGRHNRGVYRLWSGREIVCTACG